MDEDWGPGDVVEAFEFAGGGHEVFLEDEKDDAERDEGKGHLPLDDYGNGECSQNYHEHLEEFVEMGGEEIVHVVGVAREAVDYAADRVELEEPVWRSS